MRAFLFSVFAALIVNASAGDRGFVGITVRSDFGTVASVLPDSPAARAGVRAGDEIIAIGDYPTAKLKTAREFLSKVSGPPGSEIEIQLKRRAVEKVFRIKMRRMAPRKIPSDFSPYQARNGTTTWQSNGVELASR